jgi:hypothetical protein
VSPLLRRTGKNIAGKGEFKVREEEHDAFDSYN